MSGRWHQRERVWNVALIHSWMCTSLWARAMHLCMHSTLLSNKGKLSRQLIRFTEGPAQGALLWVLSWRAGPSPPDRRLMTKSKVSQEPWSQFQKQLPQWSLCCFQPNCQSEQNCSSPGRGSRARAEPGPGCDWLLPADSRAGGEHLLLYFPLTAVSADGLFLRTCQHVPTCSCQLI